ncbi:MAG: putative selenium-dependent hydroxylase accessory protein YqeC [Oscillospiraceae bacterium]|nr:putative selenium-dependent hydroxylase accessory protein YqeC [Oscillospiraceae bacterium]
MFSEELHIDRGVTAIIGGGGKTTLMYRLAEELRQRGSVIVTTSTRIWPPAHLPIARETGPVEGVLCLGTPVAGGKLGAPAQPFAALAVLADFVLVEADGSAGLPLKAHAPHEPVIPENAAQVIAVVGAAGLEQPVDRVVHRPEIFRGLSGAGETATAEAVARVLLREALHSRVLINQADSPARIAAARRLRALLPGPVTIAALEKGEIIC